MEVLSAIRQRRSARRFRDTPIPEAILGEMLDAARYAPSGGNSQNWCFGIVRDPERKKRLAEAAGGQMWISEAPVVVACCADVSWDIAGQPEDAFGLQVNKLRFGEAFLRYLCDYPDRKACMTLFENADPMIPVGYMELVAVSHGLRGCFIGWLDIERAGAVLGLPETMRCLFLWPVGYPDEEPAEKHMKTVSKISFFETWDHGGDEHA